MNGLLLRAIAATESTLGWSDAQFLMAAHVAGAIAMLFTLTMSAITMRRLRQPIRAEARSLILGFVVILAASAVYVLLMAPPLNALLLVPLTVLGLLIGLMQGWQTKLSWEHGVLVVRRSAFYVGLWAFAFIATQGLAQLQNAALHASGLLVMALTLGMGAGTTATGLGRLWWSRRVKSR